MKTLIVAALSLTLFTTACGKKSDGDKAKATEGGGKEGGGGKAAPPAKLEYKKIASLGLEVEVPSDANVDDNTANAGFPSATIWASPTIFLMGGDMIPSDFDKAKADIQKDPNPFKSFTKEDKTEGGWHLEYELESMMDKAVLYGVSIRQTIDGKVYDCGTNSSSKEEREKTIKICKSVRKAS